MDFKKSSKKLGGISYQMDHIWWALRSLKKTFALMFLEKWAILLQQDFLKTLYLHFTYTNTYTLTIYF